jgi:Protein of Unknown function (DUF2784)
MSKTKKRAPPGARFLLYNKLIMNKSGYYYAANIVFCLHFLLGIFFIIGWYFKDLEVLYVILMTSWISSWIFLGYCPLSFWEFSLRSKYDATVDPQTEIIRFYIKKILHKDVSSRKIIFVGLIVYAILIALVFVR